MRVQGQVPVEPAERKVGRFQFAFGAPGRHGAVLVVERVTGRRGVVVLDLVVVVHQPGRERRGHAEFRVVERAHVADGQFQLELAVWVREIPAVQVTDRYVVPVSLGRTFRGKLYLKKNNKESRVRAWDICAPLEQNRHNSNFGTFTCDIPSESQINCVDAIKFSVINLCQKIHTATYQISIIILPIKLYFNILEIQNCHDFVKVTKQDCFI